MSDHRIGRTWLSVPGAVPPRRTSTRVRNDGTGWSLTLVTVTSVTSVSSSRWVDAATRTEAGARDRRPVRSAYPPGVNAAPYPWSIVLAQSMLSGLVDSQ